MLKIYKKIEEYQAYIVFTLLITISVSAFLFFYSHDAHILYGDALSRLNISRKIVDNLTPGFAQLGNVWLPFPEVLMLFFVWNKDLWQTGIAGSIVSMSAYVIGGLYLYKIAKLISKSIIASLFGLSVYALNINLLYLQTTAMSESIFLCVIIIAIYYFMLWIKSKNKIQFLIFAGIAISAATLIRYEALSLLGLSIPMVFVYSFIKNKNYHKAEGEILMYLLVACLGFGIWTAYLWAIFGDPLFWLNYYGGTHVAGDAGTQLHTFTKHLSYSEAAWKYFGTMIWMNGLIPVLFAIISIPAFIYKSYKSRSWLFLPVLLSLGLLIFMIITMHRNTPINQPELSVANIISSTTSDFNEFNIRYGIIMLPTISLLCVYLLNSRFLLMKLLFGSILLIHVATYFYPTHTIIYKLPVSLLRNIDKGAYRPEDKLVKWINSNYDGGLIMISALKHDPQMFQMGYDYKTFIHEGAGKYWKESTKYPQRYATWIVFDKNNMDDQVTKFLRDSKNWRGFYDLVHEEGSTQIYKIKTKPEKEIDE